MASCRKRTAVAALMRSYVFAYAKREQTSMSARIEFFLVADVWNGESENCEPEKADDRG